MTKQAASEADHTKPSTVFMTGVLRDGLRVVIRPLRVSDRGLVAEGFQRLSERSRYARFLTGKGQLSDASLDALVDRVDHHGHEAVAMLWPRHAGPDVLVGVGRFIRLHYDPTTADVAVTVADQLQGQGAGRMLVTALAQRAHEEGVTTFTATMLANNIPSYRMMAGVGTITRDEFDDGIRETDVQLPEWSDGS